MPTKIVVDLETGQITEVELEGAELEAYNTSLAQQAAEAALAVQKAAEALALAQNTVTESSKI